jgi:hypothetical protein
MTFHRHLEMPAGSWKYTSELSVDIFSFVWRVNPTRKRFSRMLDDRVCKFYLHFSRRFLGRIVTAILVLSILVGLVAMILSTDLKYM